MEELIVWVVHVAHIEFPVLWLKRGYFIVNYFKICDSFVFVWVEFMLCVCQKTSVVANCRRGVESKVKVACLWVCGVGWKFYPF